jgi:hypothetical protein
MSIGTKLTQAILKEAAMKRPLPLEAHAQDGQVSATAKLVDHDRLGNLAESVAVRSDNAASSSTRSKAEDFANRATYLPERLGFVETEADGGAVLRSTPQTMRGKNSEYFEAKVGDNEMSLERFKPRDSGGGRDNVPFHVTDDTLARIADDAAQALQSQTKRGK